jgi:hypothetical protein
MVLCLKTWESRSSPGLQRTELPLYQCRRQNSRRRIAFDAGWSSPVARQAHNLKAAGSNPAPATSFHEKSPWPKSRGFFRWPASRSPRTRRRVQSLDASPPKTDGPQRPTGWASRDIVSRRSLGERNRRFGHRQALGVRGAFQAEIRTKMIGKKRYGLTGVKVDPDLLVRRFLRQRLIGWL